MNSGKYYYVILWDYVPKYDWICQVAYVSEYKF